jgi:serine/threonine-protein kinase RsbW
MASTPRLPAFAEPAIPPSEIALPGRFDAIGDAGDWLAAWLAPRAVADDTAFAMRLCLEEALANIVMHGRAEGTAAIDAVLAEEPGRLVLSISDDGIPFDPVTAALPESQEIGGNGLLLLRRYCSDLSYRREAGRNYLTLHFRLPDGRPTPGR